MLLLNRSILQGCWLWRLCQAANNDLHDLLRALAGAQEGLKLQERLSLRGIDHQVLEVVRCDVLRAGLLHRNLQSWYAHSSVTDAWRLLAGPKWQVYSMPGMAGLILAAS